jgi:hypothetical protein
MRRFLYFLVGAQGNPTGDLVAKGWPELAHAFGAGSSCFPRGVNGGTLGAGVVVGSGDASGLEVNPQTHDWQPIRHDGTVRSYLGVPKDSNLLPTPGDLKRDNRSVDSRNVTLGDGQSWRIPVIRFLNGHTSLPRVLMVDENGDAKFSVRKEYRALVAMADRIYAAEFQGAAQYTPDDLLWFATQALAVNYKVSAYEVAALQLVDTVNIRSIAEAALDMSAVQQLLEELKKKADAALNCGPALETGVDASLATAQP